MAASPVTFPSYPATMSSYTNKDTCTNLAQQMNLAKPCRASGGITASKQAFLPALFELNDSSHPLRFSLNGFFGRVFHRRRRCCCCLDQTPTCVHYSVCGKTLTRARGRHELDGKDTDPVS